MKKPLMIGCGLLLALVAGGLSFGTWKLFQTFSQTPADVERVADRVLGIPAPEGYTPDLCIDDLFGVSVAAFVGPGQADGFVLTEFPDLDSKSDSEIQSETNRDWADDATLISSETVMLQLGELAVPVSNRVIEQDGKQYRLLSASLLRQSGSVLQIYRGGSVDEVTVDVMQSYLDQAAAVGQARDWTFLEIPVEEPAD